jgi:hypothetical protein
VLLPRGSALSSRLDARPLWLVEHLFGSIVAVNSQEIERLRRSIAMLPPGLSAGALTGEAAMEMINDLARLDQLTARYRDTIAQLRQVL